MATIGERISNARRWKNISQEQLANKLDVHPMQIANWENDSVRPNKKSLRNLEKHLGPLDDISGQVREFLVKYRVAVPDIAKAAKLAPPTIYNLLDGSVQNPTKKTVDSIHFALDSLRKKHRNEEKKWEDEESESDANEEIETELPAFFAEGGLGTGGGTGERIKSIRLFNPNNEKQANNLPDVAGVYLFYAGNNDIGFGFYGAKYDFETGIDVAPTTIDRLQLLGTPEYIGETRNIRQRIEYWKKDHEENEDKWWFRKDWITLAAFIEMDDDTKKGVFRKELETLLIKLLSPQHNKDKKQRNLSRI